MSEDNNVNCSNCKNKINIGSMFCPYCGNIVENNVKHDNVSTKLNDPDENINENTNENKIKNCNEKELESNNLKGSFCEKLSKFSMYLPLVFLIINVIQEISIFLGTKINSKILTSFLDIIYGALTPIYFISFWCVILLKFYYPFFALIAFIIVLVNIRRIEDLSNIVKVVLGFVFYLLLCIFIANAWY